MSHTTLYSIYLNHPTVTTDSRNCPLGSIFFALHGDRFDGNLFAAKALESGAAYAVVDKPEVASDDRYIIVDDTLTALQELASEHRANLDIPVVGITGTNGKTTTKELISAVLSSHYRTTSTQGNLNNHIGVPLTLLSIPTGCEAAVVEMGANHHGEIATLAALVRPTIGLITNVGKAHLEGFGSIEGVLHTKAELYDEIRRQKGTIVMNAADKMLGSVLGDYQPTFSYSAQYGIKSDIHGTVESADPFVHVKYEGKTIKTNFIGTYNINNILAAIAVGTLLKVPTDKITSAIAAYRPGNNRSQLLRTKRNTVIVDAYNANPTSMAAAIDNFSQIKAEKKIAILGDMLELGNQSDAEHANVVRHLEALGIEAILVGREFAKCHNRFLSLTNSTSLVEYLTAKPISDSTILVKGSNGIGLQKITQYL